MKYLEPAAPLDAHAKEALIRTESDWAHLTDGNLLSMKDHIFMWAAGIDESNGDGKFILLPKDSYASAVHIRAALQKKYQVEHLGVVIVDSYLTPLREGAVGVALGYAGFEGVRDRRGEEDLFHRPLLLSRTAAADALASAATLVMGEGNESQPLALIEDAPVTFCEKVSPEAVHTPREKDMFAPLLKDVPDIRS